VGVPSGCQPVPFHAAMNWVGTLPAVLNHLPAIRSPWYSASAATSSMPDPIAFH
jgi:hypothetical protein